MGLPDGQHPDARKSDAWQVKGQAPKGLGWGPNLPYGIVAKHSLDFWLASEDLPLPDSRVTLGRDGTVKLAVQPDNNWEGVARLRATFDSMLTGLGLQAKTALHHEPWRRPRIGVAS